MSYQTYSRVTDLQIQFEFWANKKLTTLTCLINVAACLLHSYVLSVHARLLGRWCKLWNSILQSNKKLCATDVMNH